MRQSPQTSAVPPNVVEIARTYQLGTIKTIHDTGQSAQRSGSRGTIFLLIGIILVIIGIAAGSTGVIFWLFGGIMAIIGLIAIIQSSNLQATNLHVYVCEHGLIVEQHGMSPTPLRWDSLLVWRSVTKHYRNGVYTHTSYVYTLSDNNLKVTFNNNMAGIVQLGDLISENVTRARLPDYLRSYNAGQSISFGPLSLSKKGVSNGIEILPWSSVRDIDVSQGIIRVKKEGGWFSWKNVSASSVPNLFAFLVMKDAILQQYGKR